MNNQNPESGKIGLSGLLSQIPEHAQCSSSASHPFPFRIWNHFEASACREHPKLLSVCKLSAESFCLPLIRCR